MKEKHKIELPSQPDNISVLVGQISQSMYMSLKTLDDISKTIEKKIINSVTRSYKEMTEKLTVTSNMLVAIAGYVYGEKGISEKTEYRSLLSRINSKNKNVAKSISNVQNNPVAMPIVNPSEAKISVVLKGLSAKNIDSLSRFINNLDSLLDIDHIDSNVFLIGNIIDLLVESTSSLNKIKVTQSNLNNLRNLSQSLFILRIINNNMQKMMLRALLNNITAGIIFDNISLLTHIVLGDKKTKTKGLLDLMTAVNKAESKQFDIRILNDFFGKDFLDFINTISKLKIGVNISKSTKKTIIDSINSLNDIAKQFSKADTKRIVVNAEKIEAYASFIKSLNKILLYSTLISVIAIPASIGMFLLHKTVKYMVKTIELTVGIMNNEEFNKESLEALKQFTKILYMLGGLLVVGSLIGIFTIERIMYIGAFVGILYTFVLTMSVVMRLVNWIIGKSDSINDIKDFSILLTICTGVLMLGALFMLTGLWKESLQFAAILGAFVFGIMFVFKNFSDHKGRIRSSMTDFGILIAICAGVLMLGALFMKTDLAINALLFAGLVVAFMGAILGIMYVTSKEMVKVLPIMKNITYLILAITGCLIIGALFMSDKEYAKGALSFAILSVMFVGLMGLVFVGLAKYLGPANITSGILGLAAIVVASYMLTVIMKRFADIANSVKGNTSTLWEVLGITSVIVLGLGGLIIGLGFLITSTAGIGGAMFAAGVAAVGSIVGVAFILSEAMVNISVAMKTIQEVTKSTNKKDFENIGETLDMFVKLCKTVGKLSTQLDISSIKTVSEAMMTVSALLASSVDTVQKIGSARIANGWDKKGKPISFVSLSDSDLSNATKNIVNVLTTMSNAVTSVYDATPDKTIFDKENWFSRKTKFSRVVTSMQDITGLIGSVADTIVQIASLSFEYIGEDGKKHRISLNESYFGKNSILEKRISGIFSLLSNSLQRIYSENENTLFNKNWRVMRMVTNSQSAISNFVTTSTSNIKSIIDACSDIDNSEKSLDIYERSLKKLLNPNIDFDLAEKTIDNYRSLRKIDSEGVVQLVNSINSLEDEKVDKFVEFSKSLSELSGTMSGMSKNIDTVSSNIKTILDNFSDKLSEASDTIRQSDNRLIERQKRVEENTKRLKELFDNPIKIQTSSGTVGSDSVSYGGENNTPNGTSSISKVDVNILRNISGDLSDILNIIQNYISKR